MKRMLLAVLIVLSGFKTFANVNEDAILGVWRNGTGKGHVQIYKENGKYYGRIVWLLQPKDEKGLPKIDKNNPEVSQRKKPLLGLVMLRDLVYNAKSQEWSDGKIYNPNDGKEYKCYVKMVDNNTITIRGYIGFSWIGKTDTYHRVR